MPDNFLIMKNYVFIYCLLVAVLTSCESEKAGRNELHIVATDSIELDLGEPRALYGNGNMLFVIDRKAIDNFVQVYDLKTKDFLFSFAPININAISVEDRSETPTSYELFENKFREYLSDDFEIISHTADYIFDSYYFYDKDYHLNQFGAELRTDKLIEDIKAVLQ